MMVDNNRPRYRVIVLIDGAKKLAVDAVHFARQMTDDVTAFCVVDNEDPIEFVSRWESLNTGVPCVCRVAGQGGITATLMEFISSFGFHCRPGDALAVLLPRLIATKPWQRILDNSVSKSIERHLLEEEDIAVVIYPYQLMDDKAALAQD